MHGMAKMFQPQNWLEGFSERQVHSVQIYPENQQFITNWLEKQLLGWIAHINNIIETLFFYKIQNNSF